MFYDFSYFIKFKTNINNLSNNEDISFNGDRLGPGGGGGVPPGTPGAKGRGGGGGGGGGGGVHPVLRSSSVRDDRRMFLGRKILASIFSGSLI